MSPRELASVADLRGTEFRHEPVLLHQVADWLALPDGGVFVDFNVGGGGHLARIAKLSSPETELYGCDRDETALAATRSRFDKINQSNTDPVAQLKELFHAPFAGCVSLLRMRNIDQIHGALFDLGVSYSRHCRRSGKSPSYPAWSQTGSDEDEKRSQWHQWPPGSLHR